MDSRVTAPTPRPWPIPPEQPVARHQNSADQAYPGREDRVLHASRKGHADSFAKFPARSVLVEIELPERPLIHG
jgi:hypothetical protein